MKAENRVGRRRALQILTGEDEFPRSNPHLYPTHFRCKTDPEKKLKPCLLLLPQERSPTRPFKYTTKCLVIACSFKARNGYLPSSVRLEAWPDAQSANETFSFPLP